MKILVNGESKDLAADLHLEGLIQSLGLRPETVVSEVNLKIVQAADRGRTSLSEGDRVELIQFVGGG
ncbi:MAG: sulfur carrier protein ThiS [bacterium]